MIPVEKQRWLVQIPLIFFLEWYSLVLMSIDNTSVDAQMFEAGGLF